MTQTQEYHVGDIGAVIELETLIDLTGATLLKIHYRTPAGVEGVWTGTQKDAGTNKTIMTYTTTTAADFPVAGAYRVMTSFTKSGAAKTGGAFYFNVEVTPTV